MNPGWRPQSGRVQLSAVHKVLVSACLLGVPVRYDGGHSKSGSAILARWVVEGRVIAACPEVLAGLPTPRQSAEIVNARVVIREGVDLTSAFQLGSQIVATLASSQDVRAAVLKNGSPSCGSTFIYDGSFTGTTIPGEGITAALLRAHGVAVFSEDEIEAAEEYLASIETEPKRLSEKIP
jgi:uncharacterized protein YbbK (DUF523 family)